MIVSIQPKERIMRLTQWNNLCASKWNMIPWKFIIHKELVAQNSRGLKISILLSSRFLIHLYPSTKSHVYMVKCACSNEHESNEVL
jgi:hypothetical protein